MNDFKFLLIISIYNTLSFDIKSKAHQVKYFFYYLLVYVTQEARQKGAWKMMYNYVQEVSKENNAGGIRLFVNNKNQRAIKAVRLNHTLIYYYCYNAISTLLSLSP